MAVPTNIRSLLRAYGVGFSILLLSASFYYVKNGYVDQVVRIGNEVKEIERLRDVAINDPSCQKPETDKGLCAAKVFEKSVSGKEWTETGMILNEASVVAFLARMKKAAPLSCGLQSKEIEMFLALDRMKHPHGKKNSEKFAKKLKEKMGRAVASSHFKEPQCVAVTRALKNY